MPRTPEETTKAANPLDAARLMHAELQRLGCYSGAIETPWGSNSRRALELFNKSTGSRSWTPGLQVLTRLMCSAAIPTACAHCTATLATAWRMIHASNSCAERASSLAQTESVIRGRNLRLRQDPTRVRQNKPHQESRQGEQRRRELSVE